MKMLRGFTLIELLVVVIIIGLLSSLVMLRLSTARVKGYNATAKSDITQAGKAIETYKETSGILTFVNSDPVLGSMVNFSNAGTRLTQRTTMGVWTQIFNTAGALPVRIAKSPSNAHVYGYATTFTTNPGSFVASEMTSQSYCVATSVISNLSVPDGSFAITNGNVINRLAGVSTTQFSNNPLPCL